MRHSKKDHSPRPSLIELQAAFKAIGFGKPESYWKESMQRVVFVDVIHNDGPRKVWDCMQADAYKVKQMAENIIPGFKPTDVMASIHPGQSSYRISVLGEFRQDTDG